MNYSILIILINLSSFSFFLNDTATTEIYTLSLHDALPIFRRPCGRRRWCHPLSDVQPCHSRATLDVTVEHPTEDRKSTRLNSSHTVISYAVFCLKKKKKKKRNYN